MINMIVSLLYSSNLVLIFSFFIVLIMAITTSNIRKREIENEGKNN